MDRLLKPFRLITVIAVLSILVSQVFPQFSSIIHFVWILLLLLFGGIAFHEFGHVVAGWLVGFSFRQVIIWPINIIKTDHGLKIKEFPYLWEGGGVTIMVPLRGGVGRIQLIIYALGGPLFSLIAASTSLYAYKSLSTSETLFLYSFLINSFLFFGTVIPFGQFSNDGAVAYFLIRNRVKFSDIERSMKIVAEMMSGKKPREWDNRLVSSSKQSMMEKKMNTDLFDSFFFPSDIFFLFYYDLDVYGLSQAISNLKKYIEVGLKSSYKDFRKILISYYYTYKILHLFLYHTDQLTYETAQSLGQHVKVKENVLLIRIIMGVLKGNKKEVQQLMKKYDKILRSMEDIPYIEIERNLFLQLKEKISHHFNSDQSNPLFIERVNMDEL
ncbi:M50 family metallopeptidase [Thermicanus aegyptius]|uniref:M50 family metallopeptidase n=1 Tax=Thermicanus aegyptius TaxID=94009 RepID=UPI0004066C39|nr:M50 family metallopeptidase [Thermicanus aegyptius]